ncbi:MAG: protein TolR, partial [Pseudomonadota bacterium]
MGASMKQGGGGGRRARRRSHAPMAEINVTPFVDVMLVLLIIFMVAAPLLTAGVPLELPQAAGQQLGSQDQQPVVVSVTRDGGVYLGEESQATVRLDELGAKLKAVATARGGLQEPIFVRGDQAVSYGVIAQVMARIKEAGFTRLSLVTEIDQ